MIRIALLALALACLAGPAAADPVSAAVAGFVGKLLGGSKLALLVGQFVGRWVVGQALTAIGGVLSKQRKQSAPQGIQTSTTLAGGTNPQSFPLGWCATAGSLVYPRLGHSRGGLPNEYRVHVITLSDLPGATLKRLFVDGSPVELGGDPHPDYGVPVGGEYQGKLWLKYYDGSQTATDPMMLSKYGNHPDFPWTSNMVGTGVCYAILTAKYDPDFWGNSQMQFRFELLGIPVYDARKDSTAGGSGSHRADDPSTWEQTENLALLIEAVMRGIKMPTGEIWGGRSTNLPPAIWAAAKNECEVAIPLSGGGSEPQFRGGIEVTVDRQPHEIVDAFLAGCFGQMADVGGAWHIHVGAAPLPVYFFTDGDLVVTEELTRTPFPGLEDTINGVTARHPDPQAGWEYTDAPPHYNPTLEAADRDQRLLKDLTQAAVPYDLQVQRLNKAYVDDSRRFERFRASLPPDALAVNALDTIAWTSERYGFSAKLFGVTSTDKSLSSLINAATFRERDPSDGGDWTPTDEQPTFSPPPGRSSPAPLVLPGFGVAPIIILGDEGSGSRPGIEIIYTQISVASIAWRVRVKETQALVAEGIVPNVDSGRATLPFNALPATTYQVQALVNLTGRRAWTSWLDVTTHDIRLQPEDLDPAVFAAIEQETRDTVNQFATRANVPLVRDLEDFAEQASLDMAHAFDAEIKDRARLVTAEQSVKTMEADNLLQAQTILALQVSDGEQTAALNAESVARQTADQLMAADLASLLVTAGQNSAAISTETSARIAADQVTANLLNAYIASNDSAVASATQNISALVSENQAQANSLSTLFATTSGHSTTIAQQAAALAGIGGTIQASIDVNGHLSGFALTSAVQAGGAVNSAFSILADQFRIAAPNGANYTPLAIYASERTIGGFPVPPGAYFEGLVTMDKLIVTGSLSSKFATIGHFRSATSGERLEIKDDQLRVFDSNGVARITLGRL